MFHDIRNARPPLNFKLSFSPSGRDAPHEGHPAKIEAQNTCHPKRGTGRREGRESIDTWTPALDDDCIIAAYLRLCPPTRPIHDIQGGNTTLSSRGSAEGCNKRLPPDREQYTRQPQSPSKPRHHKSTDMARLSARSSPSNLLCPLHSTLSP